METLFSGIQGNVRKQVKLGKIRFIGQSGHILPNQVISFQIRTYPSKSGHRHLKSGHIFPNQDIAKQIDKHVLFFKYRGIRQVRAISGHIFPDEDKCIDSESRPIKILLKT